MDTTSKEEFRPVYHYPDGVTPVIQDSVVLLWRGDQEDSLEFDKCDGLPTLPLKTSGKLWHQGWDIPSRYAIDAEGRPWKDNAHGHALSLVSPEALINTAETDDDKRLIADALGIERPMPSWAAQALSAGWKPPDGWKP